MKYRTKRKLTFQTIDGDQNLIKQRTLDAGPKDSQD